MSSILAEKVRKLEAGAFQNLCDRLMPLVDNRYQNLQPYGSSGNRTTAGRPDAFVMLGDGHFIAFEYTTQQSRVGRKLLADLEGLADSGSCQISSQIVEVVLCYTARISPGDLAIAQQFATNQGWRFTNFPLTRLVSALEEHPELQPEFFGQQLTRSMYPKVEVERRSFGAHGGFSNGMPALPIRFWLDLAIGNPSPSLWLLRSASVGHSNLCSELLSLTGKVVIQRRGISQVLPIEIPPNRREKLDVIVPLALAAENSWELAERFDELPVFSVEVLLGFESISGESTTESIKLDEHCISFKNSMLDYWSKSAYKEQAELARSRLGASDS